jgi:hypothetical protein
MPKKRMVTPRDVEVMREMAQLGCDPDDMVDRLGFSRSTIVQHLRKNNISWRGKGKPKIKSEYKFRDFSFGKNSKDSDRGRYE